MHLLIRSGSSVTALLVVLASLACAQPAQVPQHDSAMTLTPKTIVEIDFNENGIFGSGEDVSADVLSFSIQRGKEISQHKAAAAVLDMTLNSSGHKYSPSNTASALYPFVLPGPTVRVRMGWPYDSFSDGSSTALDGASIDVGTELGTWSATAGWNEGTGVASIGTIGTQIATLDYGTPNVTLAAKILRTPGATPTYPYRQPLFTFRYVDANNYSQLYLSASSGMAQLLWVVAEIVAGVETVLSTIGTVMAQGTGWDLDTAATVAVHVKGSRVEVIGFSNDSMAASTGVVTGLTNLVGTRHGIGGTGFTTGTTEATYDDFGLYPHFIGRVDLVEPRVQDGSVTAFIRSYDDMERLRIHTLFTGTTDMLPASSGDIAARILTRANFTNGQIIDTGLNPITPAQVDTGNNNNGVPVETGTVMGGSALNEMYQLQDDEVGFFYIDKMGVARFESSDHREETDHDTPIAEWLSNVNDTYPYIREPIEWDAGIERVENRVFYKYFRFSKVLSSTVWFLEPDDDPQFVTGRRHPNATSFMITDVVAIGEELAIANPKVPRPVTDYAVFENANGTGTNWLTPITSQIGTVSATGSPTYQLDDTGRNFHTVSNTIGGISWGALANMIVIRDASGNTAVAYVNTTNPDGDGTRVNLLSFPENAPNTSVLSKGYLSVDDDFDETNTPLTYDVLVMTAYVLPGFEGNFQVLRFTAPAFLLFGSTPTGYVTSAKIVADKLSASVPASARAENTASQLSYGRRQVSHDTKHIRNWNTALGRAEKRVELRKDPRERFVSHMRNSSAPNVLEMLMRDVSDRVTIVYNDMGVDRDHYIENYRLTFGQDGGMETRWELTRVVPDSGLNYRYGNSIALYGTATYAPPE